MNKEKHLDDLFREARSQAPVQSFDDTKSRFLREVNQTAPSSGKQGNSFFSLKTLIIMITTLSTFLITLFIWKGNQHEDKAIVQPVERKLDLSVNPHIPDDAGEDHQGIPEFIALPTYKKQVSAQTQQVYYIPVIEDDTSTQVVPSKLSPSGPVVTDEYIFPKLTEKEIAANHKKKKQMMKALEKFDKKQYIRIPSGSFEYDGKTVSLQSFVIQRTEVTNLEYRTFLFDLLIQGRKDEFLKAKPDQKQWSKSEDLSNSSLSPMEENYFSHPAYNDYPVVNVSREGAEMYCKWLSQELAKFVGEEKIKEYNDVRLPGRVEWVYAASAGGQDYPYPWTGQFTRNSEGCYLANHKPTENNYGDDGGFLTVRVDSYNPNSLGLFNMSGNVAEMVYNAPNSRKEPGTAGGGWMSSPEEIKILGPDPYTGKTDAHPNIGFRVVMTVSNH